MEIFSGLKPDYESKLFNKGFTKIVGIDEVGRGSWAGPLVLGAYLFAPGLEIFERINDSKKVTELRREKLFPDLINSGEILEVSVGEIDEVGVGKATEDGVTTLVENLSQKFKGEKLFFVLDGSFPSLEIENLETVIDGDAKIYSIACASIIAKVYRDRLMQELGKSFPEYGFEKHVGYGTKNHIQAIKDFGVTTHHRTSYKPIRKLL